jgi:hypothetical protein
MNKEKVTCGYTTLGYAWKTIHNKNELSTVGVSQYLDRLQEPQKSST